MKYFIRVTVFSLLLSTACISQTIPSGRLTDWSHTGYPDAFPTPTRILNVTDFGAIPNDTVDDYPAVHLALDSLSGSIGVVYFPAGTYILHSGFDLPDSVIVRGASADSTHLIFNLDSASTFLFTVGGSVAGAYTPVLSGATRGSNIIRIVDTTGINPGSYAEIVQDNGTWDTNPASWADNSIGQIIRILSVSGDSVFFDSQLRISYDSALNIRIRKIIPGHEVGIECLHIEREDSVPAGFAPNIYFAYAANCWIKGVESSKSMGSHIELDGCTNITITGCHIHHSFVYDGTSTHGYGITLFMHTGECKIENNIMWHLRHSFSLQTGANGNVIGYNYSFDPNRSEVPSNFGADVSLHGHYPYANLIEGNVVQNIQIDQTWGPSGPFNTLFRNRIDLYGLLMTSGSAQSDSQNIVGNEIPNIPPFFGFYTLAGDGHFEYGNNIRGTATPPGTFSLPDTSYYLASKPEFFWNNSLFPPIGFPNSISSGSIPARDRYLSGNYFTVCDDDILNTEIIQTHNTITIFPNPASGLINIKLQKPLTNPLVVIRDMNGRNIFSNYIPGTTHEVSLSLNSEIKTGIYILEIRTEKQKLYGKIILM